MNRILTKKFRNLVLILIGIFCLMFAFRLGYGYTLKIEEGQSDYADFDYFDSGKQNFASTNYNKGWDKGGKLDLDYNSSAPDFDGGTSVDQKYEKIAEVKAETHQFDEDEDYVRKQVEDFEGIIQYEKKYGNDGQRKLQLQVGIPPENFDSLYQRLIGVGYTHFKQIVKNDKTNEYLELNARKASLEKTHKSLIEFKEKGGKIDEYVNLENRILEIEVELQNLGVNLGDFDESNEFCTMKFALSETKKATDKTVSFYHRSKVALEWAIAWFLRIISITFFLVFTALIITVLFEKRPLRKLFAWLKKLTSSEEEN
jgi:hypothetical protein